MRDLILGVAFFVLIGFGIRRPWLCILIWTWISYMSPHRLCWGFASTFPFAAITAGATLLSLLISREPKCVPCTRETLLLLLFVFWMTVTNLFALNPAEAWPFWKEVLKIQSMVLLTMMIMTNRWRLNALVWVIVISLGFYGVKGGLFAVLTAGRYRVQGPDGTFIGGNNEIALALTMVIPLMRYLQLAADSKQIRLILGVAQALTALAVLSTYSRGGMLALGMVAALLILKSRRRTALVLVAIAIVPALLMFMPQQWFDRMHTINDYEQDSSALGRLNAWNFAWNLAEDRPIVGGGFKVFTHELFRTYAPDPDNHHDAHSIYFEVLAEQGFPGLVMFLGLIALTWRSGSWVKRHASDRCELQWAADLTSMVQVSLAAFAIGGALLGLAYFDVPYSLMAIVVLCKILVKQAEEQYGEAAPKESSLLIRESSTLCSPN